MILNIIYFFIPYRFPKNCVLQDAWKENIGWDLNRIIKNSDKICSEHFNESDFTSSLQIRRLNDNAIPCQVINYKSIRIKNSINPIDHF